MNRPDESSTGPAALLLYPPLVDEAVFPDALLPELKAWLDAHGARAAIRDLNAVLCYYHIYTDGPCLRFIAAAREAGSRGWPLPEFPAALRPGSLFARKEVFRCTPGEIRVAAFEDFASHLYYLRTFSYLMGLDADVSDTRGAAAAPGASPLLARFLKERIDVFPEGGFPPLMGIALEYASQLPSATLLAAAAKEKSPECKVIVFGRLCGMPPAKRIRFLENNPGFDGLIHGQAHAPLLRLAQGWDGRDVPPGATMRTPLGIIEAGSSAASSIEYPVPDFDGYPLELYPSRMLPVWAMRPVHGKRGARTAPIDAAKIVGAMRRLFIDTGFETFFLGGGEPDAEALRGVANEIIGSKFMAAWNTHVSPETDLSDELCRLLYRSGCRNLFMRLNAGKPARGKTTAGIFPEKFPDVLARCAHAGLRVTVEAAIPTAVESNCFSAALETLKARAAHLDGVIFKHAPDPAPLRHITASGTAFSDDTAQRAVETFVTEFHGEKGFKLRLRPDHWIECSHRESAFRPPPPRRKVLLCYFAFDHMNPENSCTPLSLLHLRAYVRRDREIADALSIETIVLDQREDGSALIARIAALEPVFIGFSCYVWNAARTLEVCRLIKESIPGAAIALGGPEVADAEDVMRRNPSVDIIVSGEGEKAFHSLLHSLFMRGDRGLDEIGGLVFRKNGSVVSSGADRELCSMDELPTVFSPADIRAIPVTSPVFFNTMRGCFNKCKYCQWSHMPGARLTAIKRVENDLRAILRHKRREQLIAINDSSFNLNLKRMKHILSFIRDCYLRPSKYSIYVRSDLMDGDCAQLMKELGGFLIHLGAETIHADTLQIAGRPKVKEERVEEALKKLTEYGLTDNIIVAVMTGMPGDDYGKFLSTLRWCWDNQLQITVFRTLILPGTEFSASPEEYGITFDAEPPHCVIETREFSAGDIARAEKVSVNYQICLRYFGAQLLKLLRNAGFDFVGLCETLDFGDAIYQGALAEDFHISDEFVISLSTERFARRIEEGLRRIGLPDELREVFDTNTSRARL